jgi:hypothetical protein
MLLLSPDRVVSKRMLRQSLTMVQHAMMGLLLSKGVLLRSPLPMLSLLAAERRGLRPAMDLQIR